MGDVFYGLNRGDGEANPSAVQIAASTNSTDVELRISDAKGLTRNEVRNLVLSILSRMLEGTNSNYPSA